MLCAVTVKADTVQPAGPFAVWADSPVTNTAYPAIISEDLRVLTLHGHGVAGPVFAFQMPDTLLTSPGSTTYVSRLSPSDGLFGLVGSSATPGNNNAFEGSILANSSVSFAPDATDVSGRSLAEHRPLSFPGRGPTSGIQNRVSIGRERTSGPRGHGFKDVGETLPVATPEPTVLSLLALGFAGILFLSSRRQRAGKRRMAETRE